MDILSYTLGKKAGGGSAPVLQDKEVTITENGETEITADSGYDGLSSVNVTTDVPVGSNKFSFVGGGGFNFYGDTRSDFQAEINNIISNVEMSSITSFYQSFASCSNLINFDGSGLDVSNVINMKNVFQGCSSLKRCDLKTWNIVYDNTLQQTNYMFFQCSALEFLDIRNFDLSALANNPAGFMFGRTDLAISLVPANCLIIVKDNTQKQKMQSILNGRFTNVKTVAEYEGN